jgi:hypothetical protein
MGDPKTQYSLQHFSLTPDQIDDPNEYNDPNDLNDLNVHNDLNDINVLNDPNEPNDPKGIIKVNKVSNVLEEP